MDEEDAFQNADFVSHQTSERRLKPDGNSSRQSDEQNPEQCRHERLYEEKEKVGKVVSFSGLRARRKVGEFLS